MKFRKKPVVIEARRAVVAEEIQTLEGTMRAEPGDWIITGVKGEQYPCKPDIFARTYDPADDEARAALAGLCPFCHQDDELVARTINSDEDAFCDRCQRVCYMSATGDLVADDPRAA